MCKKLYDNINGMAVLFIIVGPIHEQQERIKKDTRIVILTHIICCTPVYNTLQNVWIPFRDVFGMKKDV